MSLPKISQATHSITLPVSGKKFRFRAFTVREEKIILMAKQSGQKSDIIAAFKQLIANCCLDPIDIDNMSTVDIEYFFIMLRAKSVSNITKIKIADSKQPEIEVDLEAVKVHKSTLSNKLQLDKEVGVILRHPTFATIQKLEEFVDADGKVSSAVESNSILFRELIDKIYDSKQVYETSEYSDQELDEFIADMNQEQSNKVKAFFEDMPYLYFDIEYTNAKTNEKETKRVRGLDNFFF